MFQVSDSHLVQLEIHVLGITEEDGVDAAAWFDETAHVQVSTNTSSSASFSHFYVGSMRLCSIEVGLAFPPLIIILSLTSSF